MAATTATSWPPSSSSSSDLLSKTLSSARSLVLLQLLSRVLTFSLNHALLRFASPEVFGTASIQFDLLGSTLLFLSREGVRGALLRSGRSDGQQAVSGDDKQKLSTDNDGRRARRQLDLNLSLVPLPLFLALAALLVPLYLRLSPQSTVTQPMFYPSLALHLLAYLLELLSEPYHVRLQSDLRLGVRVQAEGAAVISKAVGTLAGVWVWRETGALLGFGIGQLAYGVVLLARFALAFRGKALTMWLPKTANVDGSSSAYLDHSTSGLAMAMTQQSVVKHFLTEGDRMIVARVSPLKDQGGYAVATNYGSLVARIIFQPLEETARLYFSKSLQDTSTASASSASVEVKPGPSSGGDEVGAALTILTTLLRLSTHLLLLLPALGPPYIPLVLSILLPSSHWSPDRLRTPQEVLKIFTIYLPLMSANGMLEAFFAATATPTDLARQSRAMALFSVVFVVAAGGLARVLDQPEVGLIWANCVNSACRIAFTFAYAQAWFGARGKSLVLEEVKPKFRPILVIFQASMIARWSAVWNAEGLRGLRSAAWHVGVGGLAGVACLLQWWLSERKSLRQALGAMREKRAE